MSSTLDSNLYNKSKFDFAKQSGCERGGHGLDADIMVALVDYCVIQRVRLRDCLKCQPLKNHLRADKINCHGFSNSFLQWQTETDPEVTAIIYDICNKHMS